MKKDLIQRATEKARNLGAKTREICAFVKENPAERLKRAASDYFAITLPNTLALGNIETHLGNYLGTMTPQDSADMRLYLSATNPFLGLLRDIERNQTGVDKLDDKKASKKLDFKVFAQVAGAEFLINVIKYGGIKIAKGDKLNFRDIAIPAAAAFNTLCAGKTLGRCIETFRDGFCIDSANNQNSYFSINMPDSEKKIRTTALSLFSAGALASYYALTR